MMFEQTNDLVDLKTKIASYISDKFGLRPHWDGQGIIGKNVYLDAGVPPTYGVVRVKIRPSSLRGINNTSLDMDFFKDVSGWNVHGYFVENFWFDFHDRWVNIVIELRRDV